jgi:EmrB/QacA subfamily drug resistance transporter
VPVTDRKWLALIVLCLGDVMIVIDSTIVNVALPSIRADLGFSETGLSWVVNAFLLTFGGFLLLSGRLGDLLGHRRVFLVGIVSFTTASLVCGLSPNGTFLIIARSVQGLGGALVSAVALSLTMVLFPEPGERAKAMGIFGFVSAGGGSLGVVLGGVLTDTLNWRWVFLVNLPVGIAVFIASLVLVPGLRPDQGRIRLDASGAITVTASLVIAVYAIIDGNNAGWGSARTLGLLAVAVALMGVFIVIESRVAEPLIPLRLFLFRNIVISNWIAVLWAAGMFAWFFLAALYLQIVLGYSPLAVGLAFAPSDVVMGLLSLGISAKLVLRFGIRIPLIIGLMLAGLGLLLFARAPVDGSFAIDVLPSMILLGIGGGLAFNPLLLAAMGGVPSSQSGFASGMVNTSFMMGGALGLAVLASVADARTQGLRGSGSHAIDALTGGYHLAFAVGALFAIVGAICAYWLLEPEPDPESDAPAADPDVATSQPVSA